MIEDSLITGGITECRRGARSPYPYKYHPTSFCIFDLKFKSFFSILKSDFGNIFKKKAYEL